MSWINTLVSPSLNIQFTEAPEVLSRKDFLDIEHIWSEARKTVPSLYNGTIFYVQSLSPECITGYWGDYKYLYAQLHCKNLRKKLKLMPLSVNGLIHCPEGFILGLRSKKSIYLPHYWQSPPAGFIEKQQHGGQRNLLTKQLYTEANEELGLTSNHIISTTITSSTTHEQTHIVDIGFLIEVSLTFNELLFLWKKSENNEYEKLGCFAVETLDFPSPLIPTTGYLISQWKTKPKRYVAV